MANPYQSPQEQLYWHQACSIRGNYTPDLSRRKEVLISEPHQPLNEQPLPQARNTFWEERRDPKGIYLQICSLLCSIALNLKVRAFYYDFMFLHF